VHEKVEAALAEAVV